MLAYITAVWVSCDCSNKSHRVGGLGSEGLFLTVLEVGMFKFKVTADSVSPEDLLSICRWLPSCSLRTRWERASLSRLLTRALIPFKRAPPSRPPYLPKAPPPKTTALRIRTSTWGFGRDPNMRSTAMILPSPVMTRENCIERTAAQSKAEGSPENGSMVRTVEGKHALPGTFGLSSRLSPTRWLGY